MEQRTTMADRPRKISLTVREASNGKFDVVLSVDGAVVQSNGPHGKYTALGRLDDYGEALQRFILWRDVPELSKPERDIAGERKKLAEEAAKS